MRSIYVDEEIHRLAKVRATEEGKSLKQLIEEFMARGLESPVVPAGTSPEAEGEAVAESAVEPIPQPEPPPVPVAAPASPLAAPASAPAPVTRSSFASDDPPELDPAAGPWLDQMERTGLLVRSERLRGQLTNGYMLARSCLTTPPGPWQSGPSTVAEIRALFSRLREQNPGAPAPSDLLHTVREEG